ncbi:MAG: hypothetical protein MUC68_13815 [Burkholderiaceae bacterium]|jgi:enamine deaminase RidA (YjgF/YER057c/UK114 family)|nr:hypothetical protein [Burkholderiaceae bacterium]
MNALSIAAEAPWLRLRHLSPAALTACADASLLGAALIADPAAAAGAEPAGVAPADVPLARVPLAPLAGGPIVEAWQVPAVRERVRLGAADLAWSDAVLFGSIDPRRIAAADSLQATTRATYDALFAALAHAGFPYLLRAWNYMPAINREAGEPDGLERYRQFNLGRVAAFEAARAPIHEGAPAACALGSAGGDLTVYFLAIRRAPEAIENPRQISAYRYPAQYGPRSPTFSRAALLRAADGAPSQLFVSGTASIVGHATVHGGDVAAQTRETLANIEAVCNVARSRLGDSAAFAPDRLSYKVYVRHPTDLPAVQRELAAAIGPALDAIYLQADICRADLLVEIEAVG